MLGARKRSLFTIVGAIGLLVLIALAALRFVDVNRFKHRLEVAASEALGMDIRARGRLSKGFFPAFRLTAEDVDILNARGVAVATAKKASLWIALRPLLRKQFRLRGVELTQPKFSIERDPDGKHDADRLKTVAAVLGALDGASLSVADGVLLYIDKTSGQRLEATGCHLDVPHMRFAKGGSPHFLKGLALEAEFGCEEIRTKDLSLSALKVSIHGNDGVFELEPATLQIFSGQAAGTIRADFSQPIPHYEIRCDLPHFRIEEFLKTLSPTRAAEGAMDFSATLSMQGETASEMVRTAAGVTSLHGKNLTLVGNDLDRELSRYQSSQGFNLVDVGAFFVAGPVGLAVTKGYNFASLFRGSGGSSNIETVVSDWKVEHGVAQAKDVAMATSKNRIALQGGLDFPNGQFADVTVAVVDAKGCASVRQAIVGSFAKPVVEKPRFLKALAGPVLKLYRQARGLFPAGPCEVFYSGSVAAPR